MKYMDELRHNITCDLLDRMFGADLVSDENHIKLSYAAERILNELLLASYLVSDGHAPSKGDKAGAMIVVMSAVEAFATGPYGLSIPVWPDYGSLVNSVADSVARHNQYQRWTTLCERH